MLDTPYVKDTVFLIILCHLIRYRKFVDSQLSRNLGSHSLSSGLEK